MILLKRYRLAIAFLACAFCVAAIGYSWFPSRIAVHWNMSAQADRWMAKPFGAFILPVIGVVLTAILITLAPKATPRIQPDTTSDAYARVVAAVAAFLLYATIAVAAVAAGLELKVPECNRGGCGRTSGNRDRHRALVHHKYSSRDGQGVIAGQRERSGSASRSRTRDFPNERADRPAIPDGCRGPIGALDFGGRRRHDGILRASQVVSLRPTSTP